LVFFQLLFSLTKKVTKKSSQNDVPALFVFTRFASKRGLKLFWAHLINTNSQLVRRRVLTGLRAFRSEVYKREVLALCNRRFIAHLYLTIEWWTSDCVF